MKDQVEHEKMNAQQVVSEAHLREESLQKQLNTATAECMKLQERLSVAMQQLANTAKVVDHSTANWFEAEHDAASILAVDVHQRSLNLLAETVQCDAASSNRDFLRDGVWTFIQQCNSRNSLN
jgi:hypothetical protein